MLEPILGPRTGMGLNLVGLLFAGFATLLSATVTTLNGVVPMVILSPIIAIGFAARMIGCGIAASRGVRAMPWGPRVTSWIAFGVAAALLGFGGSIIVVAAFGAFVALDAAAGLVKREEAARPARTAKGLWARIRVPLLVSLYLMGVLAFHLLVGVYLPYGTLITWTLLALLFAMAVRATLNGPKAKEPALLAPPDHRLHERREEAVADPHRQRAEDALLAVKARGDAGAFLDFVREAARAADLPATDVALLEQRILASFARARTSRDDDVRAALAEVEQFLSPRVQKEVPR